MPLPAKIAAWISILIYIALVITQHETVQGFLGPWADWMGRPLFYNLMGIGASLLAIAITLCFWRWSALSVARQHLRFAMVTALVLTIASFFLLTVNNAEVVHYPQYAILAVLLFPWFLSVGETVAWCSLVGLLDEAYQYFVLHPTWGVPWDFNDVTLDICGAGLGALFIASRYQATPRIGGLWWNRTGLLFVTASVSTLPILVALNKVQLYENKDYVGWWFALSRLRVDSFWFYDASWGSRTIHLLSPTEGPALMLILVLLSSLIDRKYTFAK